MSRSMSRMKGRLGPDTKRAGTSMKRSGVKRHKHQVRSVHVETQGEYFSVRVIRARP